MNDFDEGWFLNTLNMIGQILAWLFTHVIGYIMMILFVVYLIIAITSSDDPSGRCEYEPGPNGMTVSYCEPDD